MTIEIKTHPSLLSLGTGNPDDGGYRVPDGMMLVGVLIPVEYAPRLTGATPVTLTIPDAPAVMPPRVPSPVPATSHASLSHDSAYEYGLQVENDEPAPLFIGDVTEDPEQTARQCAAYDNRRGGRVDGINYTYAVRRLPGGQWERLA